MQTFGWSTSCSTAGCKAFSFSRLLGPRSPFNDARSSRPSPSSSAGKTGRTITFWIRASTGKFFCIHSTSWMKSESLGIQRRSSRVSVRKCSQTAELHDAATKRQTHMTVSGFEATARPILRCIHHEMTGFGHESASTTSCITITIRI